MKDVSIYVCRAEFFQGAESCHLQEESGELVVMHDCIFVILQLVKGRHQPVHVRTHKYTHNFSYSHHYFSRWNCQS